MGWRPIDSAPRDGTRILLGKPGFVTTGTFLDNSASRWPWAGWHTVDGPFGEHATKPLTHWQPLPEPPEAMAATRGREASSGQGNSTEQSHNRSSLTGTVS